MNINFPVNPFPSSRMKCTSENLDSIITIWYLIKVFSKSISRIKFDKIQWEFWFIDSESWPDCHESSSNFNFHFTISHFWHFISILYYYFFLFFSVSLFISISFAYPLNALLHYAVAEWTYRSRFLVVPQWNMKMKTEKLQRKKQKKNQFCRHKRTLWNQVLVILIECPALNIAISKLQFRNLISIPGNIFSHINNNQSVSSSLLFIFDVYHLHRNHSISHIAYFFK